MDRSIEAGLDLGDDEVHEMASGVGGNVRESGAACSALFGVQEVVRRVGRRRARLGFVSMGSLVDETEHKKDGRYSIFDKSVYGNYMSIDLQLLALNEAPPRTACS